MKIYLTALLTLLSIYTFAQKIEAFCEPVTIVVDDPYVQHTIDAKDLISSIVGGTPPYSYAFYTPDGPDQITVSCLDEGTIELEVNVIDANQEVSSCLGVIDVELSNVRPASEICNTGLAASLDKNGEYVLILEHLELENYCGIQHISFGKVHFNCSDLTIPGSFNPVSMVVTLVDGSTFNCSLKLIIFDESDPTITCPSNINLALPPGWVLNLTPQLLGISAQGLCEVPSLTLSKSHLTCSDIGQTLVTATASLSNGSQSTCQVIVTLSDPTQSCSPQAYCECKGQNSDLYIDQLTFGDIDHHSGNDGGYADFTGIPTEVQKGRRYLFSLTPVKPDYTRRRVFTRVWIDWNRNGDFERKELAYHKSQRRGERRGFIRIPRSAKIGATRMRVLLSLAVPPNPCGDIAIGEVEDYTLFILPFDRNDRSLEDVELSVPLAANEMASEDLQIFPNPASDILHIRIPEAMPKGIITITNISGQVIQTSTYETSNDSANNIDITHFSPGVYYLTIAADIGGITKALVVQ